MVRSFPAVCMPSPASTQTSWASLSFSCPTMPPIHPRVSGWLAGTDPRREGHGKWNQYIAEEWLSDPCSRLSTQPLTNQGPPWWTFPQAFLPQQADQGPKVGEGFEVIQWGSGAKAKSGTPGPLLCPLHKHVYPVCGFQSPSRAPHLLPTPSDSLYPRTCSCWPACLSQTWAFCCSSSLPEIPFLHPWCLLYSFPTYQTPTHTSGPVNGGLLLLQESFPWSSAQWLSPCLCSSQSASKSQWLRALEGRKQPLLSNFDVISIYQ